MAISNHTPIIPGEQRGALRGKGTQLENAGRKAGELSFQL
jgi:hypothetical protein